MNNIINQIDKLKAEIGALMPINKDVETKLWEKFQLEWNYNSNHIEGNTLSFNETKTLFHLGDEFRAQNNSLKDVQEMQAHDVAIEMVKQWAKDKERLISESEIRALNKTILVKPFWLDAVTTDGKHAMRQIIPGEYKKHPNHVQLKSGEIFKYAEPNEVPQKMQELLDWYVAENEKEHPLITAAFLHYKFVCIHPFDDGNGRVSRLLMNYHLLRNGYPPVIIKSKDKDNYLYALQQADTENTDAFIKYVGEQLVWSLELQLKAAKGENIEETDDLYKELEVWKKNVLIGKKLKRTEAIVQELLDTTFMSIYNKANPKIEKFKDVFNDYEKTISYYIPYTLHSSLPNLNDTQIEIENREDWVTYILHYFLNPKLVGANKFRIIFRFKFPEDKYELAYITIIEDENIDFKPFAEKFYNERFTEIEIDDLIKKVMEEAFEKIKEAYS